METNNIDKTIKQKFENRTFTPSASAWERLSVQLDEQPKTAKKPWFLYVSIAASILILMVLGIQFLTTEKQVITPTNDVVVNPFKEIITKEKQILEPIQTIENKVIVENREPKKQQQKPFIKNDLDVLKSVTNNSSFIAKTNEKEVEMIENQPTKTVITPSKINKIKVNAADLLYAVTHNADDVKKYYAQHQINREELLQTIENELKKSNVKVNPETILAEVERTITEDDFQNNFLQFLKKRVSDIAVAIASRND